MKNEKHSNSRKKVEKIEYEMRWIEDAGLEGGQIGKPLSKVTIPEGQRSRAIALIQAIAQRIKIIGQVAIKRNLTIEYEILAEPKNAEHQK